jgi:hypothetical protein
MNQAGGRFVQAQAALEEFRRYKSRENIRPAVHSKSLLDVLVVLDPAMLGRLVHLGIDALIISAFLAAVKRSTGLTYVFLRAYGDGSCSPRSVLHYLKYLTKTSAVSVHVSVDDV